MSRTLHAITTVKVRELGKQRDLFEKRKRSVFTEAGDATELAQKVTILSNGRQQIPELKTARAEQEVAALDVNRTVRQAKVDPSFPQQLLRNFQQDLTRQYEQESRKLAMTDLHTKLLTQWVQHSSTIESQFDGAETATESGEDSFEVIRPADAEEISEIRKRFSQIAFQPAKTDVAAVRGYLEGLFAGEDGAATLKTLRERLQVSSKTSWESTCLTDSELESCINNLLKIDTLLSTEKKAMLREFTKDKDVLCDIRDLINMRLRDIETWDWNLEGRGFTIAPQRGPTGKWRVIVDKDIIEAILTHYVANKWSVEIRQRFWDVMHSKGSWRSGFQLPKDHTAKMEYFSPHSFMQKSAKQSGNCLTVERQQQYKENFFLLSIPKRSSDSGSWDDYDGDSKSSDKTFVGPKQRLLRMLTTEIIIERALHGEVAVVQSDLKWFSNSMSHAAIFEIARYIGISEDWVKFFEKALTPPIDMQDGSPVRRRQCGLPTNHKFSQLFGEMILFFMDMAVARKCDLILYRHHDDLWLVGNPARCASAWKVMNEFVSVMGLELNDVKTGSVYITADQRKRDRSTERALPQGPVIMEFLKLDAAEGHWVIDEKQIREHALRLKTALGESESVIQWVKTYNSCVGKFLSWTLGEPANCLGLRHLNSSLKCHQDFQNILFENDAASTGVTASLKALIARDFGEQDISDSFLFMPEALGGLGVVNPFINLVSFQKSLELKAEQLAGAEPECVMDKYFKQEREAYKREKKAFKAIPEDEKRASYRSAFKPNDDPDVPPVLLWSDAQKFISWEEWVRYRELESRELYDVYSQLMKQPAQEVVWPSSRIKDALRQVRSARVQANQELKIDEDDSGLMWLISSYEAELFEKYGGVEVCHRSKLPLGVLNASNSKKFWPMLLA